MIRHRQGSDFLLITQDDHARLSGRFAEHLGNGRFAPPEPRAQTLRGIALHDCGWPLHDERPTLNPRREPLHVLESPMTVATRVWTESARLAAEADPYSGLLVSLHVLNLSSIAQRNDGTPHERAQDRQDLFLLNRFQQQEIERQEELRRSLGMRTDLPLRLGLAKPGSGADEDRLRFNFGLLRAMDAFSLDACCAEPLFPKVPAVHPRPGEGPIDFTVDHPSTGVLAIEPWPFDVPVIEETVPCRRVPAVAYESERALWDAFDAAMPVPYAVRLVPRRASR
jgi:hypothetical protein